MAQGRLIGQNYTTPDLVAKVTGRARYAEDYRAEGMLFCKLLLSPMPHCRIRRIDTAAALAIPGVRAVLTADDLPPVKAPDGGLPPERALTNEPVYQGEPVLAVAAVDEWTAAEAIEAITRGRRIRCRSSSIRSPACGPAAPTPASRATRSWTARWPR